MAAVSSEAVELLNQQTSGPRSLRWILATMQKSSPAQYRKEDHWAWYVWPTFEVAGYQCETAVKGEADVQHVLSNPENTRLWAAILEFCAEAVNAQESLMIVEFFRVTPFEIVNPVESMKPKTEMIVFRIGLGRLRCAMRHKLASRYFGLFQRL